MWDKVVIQATPILILTQNMLNISELYCYLCVVYICPTKVVAQSPTLI